MKQTIATIALVVRDYDEAIDFYCNKLQFVKVEDTVLSADKRWVLVSPPGSDGASTRLLFAKASNEEQQARVGNQTGGRVFLFLYTDDLQRDYESMIMQDILFTREPTQETWGSVAVFQDLYGNLWDLIELNKSISK